jgi:hypothetical protein
VCNIDCFFWHQYLFTILQYWYTGFVQSWKIFVLEYFELFLHQVHSCFNRDTFDWWMLFLPMIYIYTYIYIHKGMVSSRLFVSSSKWMISHVHLCAYAEENWRKATSLSIFYSIYSMHIIVPICSWYIVPSHCICRRARMWHHTIPNSGWRSVILCSL